MPILLEVCVASESDARAAEQGGADRLELNSALSVGGLTPTRGLLRCVLDSTRLPVVPMLRPRPGACAYDSSEFRTMQRDLDDLLAEKVAGVAIGILLPDGRIDLDRMAALIKQAAPTQIICHRAFDLTPDPQEALEQLIDLGVQRVLTSGQEDTAFNGQALIGTLIQAAAGRIELLPGGGINRFNVADLVTHTGCTQVHASLRSPRIDPSGRVRPKIRFGRKELSGEDQIDGTDAVLVADLVTRLKSLG